MFWSAAGISVGTVLKVCAASIMDGGACGGAACGARRLPHCWQNDQPASFIV
jgi:hypothetical protein